MLSYFLFNSIFYMQESNLQDDAAKICIFLVILFVVYLLTIISILNESKDNDNILLIIINMIKRFSLSKLIKFTISKSAKNKTTGYNSIIRIANQLGYDYDKEQDIFYSIKNAWQKKYGYCKVYDEKAAYFNMIIDCEPIYFNYDNRKWLIELWKGQYGMTTGCEVGVYVEDEKHTVEGEMTYYKGVEESDMLSISMSLIKNDKVLFKRKEKHWWLTGFKVGEFSNPSDLKVRVNITLKDKKMLRVFRNALKLLGYTEKQLWIHGNNISFVFDKPYSKQPNIDNELIKSVQKKNELLCRYYNELVNGYNTIEDKFDIIKEDGILYDVLLNTSRFESE